MTNFTIFGLAARNLRRNILRTLVLSLITAVVTGTLFGTSLLFLGMKHALDSGSRRLGADVLVVPVENEVQLKSSLLAGEPSAFSMSGEVLKKVRSVEGVRHASPQLFLKPTPFSCCYNVDIFLVAIDPDTDFTITPWTRKSLGKPLSGNLVIAGSDIPAMTGDTIPFFGTLFTIGAKMEPTGIRFFDRSVFMTLHAAHEMAENSKRLSNQPLDLDRDRISAVLVQTEKHTLPEKAAIRIEYEINGVKAIPSDEILSTVRRQLSGIKTALILVGAAVWLMTLLIMGFAFSMIVNERRKEVGLLRAMGAGKGHIQTLFITEAAVISIVGGVLGVLTGISLLIVFQSLILRIFSLPYLLPSSEALAGLAGGILLFSVLTGVLASALPAISAGRTDLHTAIHKGL